MLRALTPGFWLTSKLFSLFYLLTMKVSMKIRQQNRQAKHIKVHVE